MGDSPPDDCAPESVATLMVKMAAYRDEAAFSTIFQVCAPKVMRYLIERSNGNLPLPVIEEVCQETFARAWHDSTEFDPKKHEPIGWLFQNARTLATAALHRQNLRENANGEIQLQQPEPRPLDDSLAASEQIKRLRKTCANLLPVDQELLHDAFVRGMSYSKIAAARQMPLGTVKSRIRFAFRHLRACLQDPEP